MGYSPERKTAMLKWMLPPNNMAIRRLSQQEGISGATLHKWRAEARGKGSFYPIPMLKSFANWYNGEHLHSAIRFVTPNMRHVGQEGETL